VYLFKPDLEIILKERILGLDYSVSEHPYGNKVTFNLEPNPGTFALTEKE
jgi:hypothetical protein